MSADILDRLAAVDPAATMPETVAEDDERLVRAVLSTPIDPRRRLPRRRLGRRRVLLLSAGTALLLVGGTAAAETYLLEPLPKSSEAMNAEQWRDEYWDWTKKLQLPPGAQWRGENVPANDSTGVGAGAMDAVMEAIGHWTKDWIAADMAGDETRAATAAGWVMRLRDLIPVNTDNGGYASMDKNGGEYWDTAIAEAQEGRFAKLGRLVLSYTFWSTPEPTPNPTHYNFDWVGTGASQNLITPDQVRAEYEGVLQAVGVPPGMDAPMPREVSGGDHCLGEGFEEAFDDVWTAWWREWAAAFKAGNQDRVAAAAAATARLQGLVPRTLWQSGRVLTLDLEGDSRRDLERLSAQANAGDIRGVEEWLAFQEWYARSMRDAAGYDDYETVMRELRRAQQQQTGGQSGGQ
jgi:hypothetical protein